MGKQDATANLSQSFKFYFDLRLTETDKFQTRFPSGEMSVDKSKTDVTILQEV